MFQTGEWKDFFSKCSPFQMSYNFAATVRTSLFKVSGGGTAPELL